LARAHKNNCWKHPNQKDYFFGVHDDNRLQFTVGRDIRLDPPQQGGPLNYFIYRTRTWMKEILNAAKPKSSTCSRTCANTLKSFVLRRLSFGSPA
jgi:hypothetical protein